MTDDETLPWDAAAGCRPFPLPPPGSVGPPPEYGWLRRECPVARVRTPVGVPGWFASRYGDVRELLADRRLVRPTIDAWPEPPRASPAPDLVTMMEMEGQRHRALRYAVAGAFGGRALAGRRSRIRELADHLLDEVEAGARPADLVPGFAEPFPLLVLCDLVGIPYEERHEFVGPADFALGAMSTLEQGREATRVLRRYVRDLVRRKRAEPADDVLTSLVRQCDAGAFDEEAVVSFGLSMLVAGYRTTTMFLANAILVLLQRPEQFAQLCNDRSALPRAVEELLRFLPVMNGPVVLRAVEPLRVAGAAIGVGEAVLPSIAAANRDGSVFARAEELDLGRARPQHLAFGRGRHSCVGAPLGRAELEVGLDALLDRLPGMRLAVAETEIVWEDDAPEKSPLCLPVTW